MREVQRKCRTCVNWVGEGFMYGSLLYRRCRLAEDTTSERMTCNGWAGVNNDAKMDAKMDYNTEMKQLLEQLLEVLSTMQKLMQKMDAND